MQTVETSFRVVEMPARQLAYLRHVGPYMGDTELFERLFSQVFEWLLAKGINQPDMESISVYHDDPDKVPAEQQRISVGFTVPLGTSEEGDIKMMDLPAGKYLVGSFEIDSTGYREAWEDLFEFIGDNQLKPASSGLMYESYKNDPNEHPEGKHLVDICVALS